MTDREHALLLAAENVQGKWQAYRLYPEQYYVEICNAMRRLDAAAEAYSDDEFNAPPAGG